MKFRLSLACVLGLIAGAALAATQALHIVVGTPTSSVPAGAAAAGFTTVALNSDFTLQMPAGWLGGCPNPGDGQYPLTPQYNDDGGPHIWWMNIWWSAAYQGCSVGQVTDPDLGGLVLHMPWTVDNNFNGVGTVIQTASWDYNANGGWPSNPQGQSHDYPNNAYYEVVARMTPIATGAYYVLNTWGPFGISPTQFSSPSWPGIDGYSQSIEWDVEEIETGALWKSSAGVHNWGNGNGVIFLWCEYGGCGAPPGINSGTFDPNIYHTFGIRVTSDGATMVGCAYVDNVFINCGALPGGLSAFQAALGRNFLVLQNACDWWNQPGGQCTQGQEQHLYVKSVRVWSCASWATTQCNGSVLSGPP